MKRTTPALLLLVLAAVGCSTVLPTPIASSKPAGHKVKVEGCIRKVATSDIGTHPAQYCDLVTSDGKKMKIWLTETLEGVHVRMAGNGAVPVEALTVLQSALPQSDLLVYVGVGVQPPQGWASDEQLGFIRYDRD